MAADTAKSNKMTWILLGIPIAAVLMPSCLLLLVLMMPTMVVFIVDGSPGRKFVVTVGLMNLAGSVPALAELWSHGQTFQAAFDGMGDVFAWAGALMASGIGWLIYWIMPPIVSNYQGIASKTQVLALRKKQKKLVETWGEEVAVVAAQPYQGVGEGEGEAQDEVEET